MMLCTGSTPVQIRPMSLFIHDTNAPRHSVSVSLNSDLIARARAAKIIVLAVSEAALVAALQE